MPETNGLHRHLLSVVLRNTSGNLARVIGLFSGRGYNIDSLTVGYASSAEHAEIAAADGGISRMTIVVMANDSLIQQIISQINKLIDVIAVRDMTYEPTRVETDITLVKVMVSDPFQQAAALTIATMSFRATAIITRPDCLIFRFPGRESASRDFVQAMERHGPVESAYGGTVVIA